MAIAMDIAAGTATRPRKDASRAAARIGWAMSGLTVVVLVADAANGLIAPQSLVAEMAAAGWAMERAPVISAIVLLCAVVYAIPRTAVLGAILVSGFLGGAIATHVRTEDGVTPPMLIALAIAGFAWGGLWLRDARVRALLPLA